MKTSYCLRLNNHPYAARRLCVGSAEPKDQQVRSQVTSYRYRIRFRRPRTCHIIKLYYQMCGRYPLEEKEIRSAVPTHGGKDSTNTEQRLPASCIRQNNEMCRIYRICCIYCICWICFICCTTYTLKHELSLHILQRPIIPCFSSDFHDHIGCTGSLRNERCIRLLVVYITFGSALDTRSKSLLCCKDQTNGPSRACLQRRCMGYGDFGCLSNRGMSDIQYIF